jgi:hypothetical protein
MSGPTRKVRAPVVLSVPRVRALVAEGDDERFPTAVRAVPAKAKPRKPRRRRFVF